MKILYLYLFEVLQTHHDLITKSGGLSKVGYSIAEQEKINSILEHMQNDDYYPTFLDKLTHLIYSIIKNHIFLDGNKRASIVISLLFLSINGYKTQDFRTKYITTMEDIVVDVAQNAISKDELQNILSKLLNISK